MSESPRSQGTTPMVGCRGQCGSGSASSQHCLLVTRGCLLCCAIQRVPTASTSSSVIGGLGVGGFMSMHFAFSLVMVAASLQLPGFSAVSLTLSPSLAMVLAGCSVIAAAQFLHCYHISWDCRGHQNMPAASLSLPTFTSPLLILTCLPSGVFMHGSQTLLCVEKGSFVELYLSKLM